MLIFVQVSSARGAAALDHLQQRHWPVGGRMYDTWVVYFSAAFSW